MAEKEFTIGKKVKLAHVIANENPTKFMSDVDKFCDGKELVTVVYNSTPVMMGMQKAGIQMQAAMSIVMTCYIEFACTEQEAKDFIAKQTLKLS